jgi:hypothetical protein
MDPVRVIGVAAALGFALFWGYVLAGMSETGDPNVLLAAVGIVVCLVAAVVIALGPAKLAAGVAIVLGALSGLGALPSIAYSPSDGIWLGITAVALIAAGIRLLRPDEEPTAG